MLDLLLHRELADRTVLCSAILSAALLVTGPGLHAQERATSPDSTKPAVRLTPISVTATLDAQDVFRIANPVLVADSQDVRRQAPNTAADLFRNLPGVDVTGAGTNQSRFIVRGQRGQRILLLEDGLRMNNSRRQQDFGELPGIVDVDELQRIEVVRGPASVQYGTDAIGGVVNLITRQPTTGNGETEIHGSLGYRYSDRDRQSKPFGHLDLQVGRLAIGVNGSYRKSSAYDAPGGTFGNLHLNGPTRVNDTGVRDKNVGVGVSYGITDRQRVFARFNRYDADSAGFGYVDNSALGAPADEAVVRILYPEQQVDRFVAGYRATGLGTPVADRLEVTGYRQSNERVFTIGVTVPFGPPAPPGAGVQSDSRNFTDVDTYGFRVEAAKLVMGRHLITYGADLFRDRSNNTDSSLTTVSGFGPPIVDVSTAPSVPNATFRSAGVFIQGELRPISRVSLTLGVRGQDVRAATRPTTGVTDPLVESSARTGVGSASMTVGVTRNLNVVSTVGRAFRSPNLVERFFNGPTPEGSAFQIRTPNLRPETSLNVDLGLKFRTDRLYAEGFVFQNSIHDGIRVAPTGTNVGPFPAFQNVNIDRIRDRGVELFSELILAYGFSLRGHFTHLSSKDVLNPSNPVGDSYSTKLGGELQYQHPSNRFWGGFDVRHNGERKDIDLGTNPIGATIPRFTVMSVRGGVNLFRVGRISHSVTAGVYNLTNQLYSEASNTSFFRPEPGRNVTVSYRMGF